MPSENGSRPTAKSSYTSEFTVTHFAQDIAEAREQADQMGKTLFDRPETKTVTAGPVLDGDTEPHPFDYDS